MDKKRVCVAVPVYGSGTTHEFDESFLKLLGSGLFDECKRLTCPGDSLVSRARNTLVMAFLRDTDSENLLFIDSDIPFEPSDVMKLVESEEPIICGLYTKKKEASPPEFVMNMIPGTAVKIDGTVQEVLYAGTGFLRIKREVLERMEKLYPERNFMQDHDEGGRKSHDWFPVGVVGNRYLSEDWFFCHVARQMGYRIMAHTGVLLDHVGKKRYIGQIPKVNSQLGPGEIAPNGEPLKFASIPKP